MNLTELYKDLSHGKLSNLSMSNESNGTISVGGKPKIILATNEALLRLHTKFVLKENSLLLELVDHITNYHLLSKFAESTDPQVQPYPYIKDLGREPFEEDVVRILLVQDEFGCTLPLNDEGQVESVFTPQGNVLQVPRPSEGRVLVVMYQAKHARLVDNGDETQEIELPDCLQEAMRCYVAYHIFCGIGTQEATAKGQEHLMMYEALCQDALSQDLVSTSLSVTSNRFTLRGWV